MYDPNWWRRYVISVPLPIPRGYMVGMKGETRNGEHYVVEFLEKVPGYQPNPYSKVKRGRRAGTGDEGEVVLAWSREEGFTVTSSE